MKLRKIKVALPKPQRCRKCREETIWERQGDFYVELEMHSCQCPDSDYQKEIVACKAKGGHFPVELDGGSHAMWSCSNCGHSC